MSDQPAPHPSTRPVVWHNRALLLTVAVIALIAATLNVVGLLGFPSNAPIEGVYCIGVIVDLIAVAITLGVLTSVEFTRRAEPGRGERGLDTRISVFTILAVVFAGVTALAWTAGGGLDQLITVIGGQRTRYMYATGAIFVAGIPWALALIFGAWGFRPGGHRVGNVLALIALVLAVLLAVPVTLAALVYGAGLGD